MAARHGSCPTASGTSAAPPSAPAALPPRSLAESCQACYLPTARPGARDQAGVTEFCIVLFVLGILSHVHWELTPKPAWAQTFPHTCQNHQKQISRPVRIWWKMPPGLATSWELMNYSHLSNALVPWLNWISYFLKNSPMHSSDRFFVCLILILCNIFRCFYANEI